MSPVHQDHLTQQIRAVTALLARATGLAAEALKLDPGNEGALRLLKGRGT